MDQGTSTNEAALICSEIRYRRLFESAQDGILILDAHSQKITDANPFIADLLGYSREELLGKELWQIGLLKDEDFSRASFQRLQRDRFIRYENLPLQTRSGRVREVEFVSNVYDEAGTAVVQCNIRDVAERKALQEAKFFLAAIVESFEDSIITVGPDGIITTWNNAAERIYGYSAAQAVGQPLSMLALPGAADLQSCFDRIMHGDPVARFEVARECKDGSRVFLSVQLSPVKDLSGRIIAVATVSRDITCAKAADEIKSFLAAIVGSTDDSIITVDVDGRITTWNHTAQSMYGYAPAEAIGKCLTMLNLPGEAAHTLRLIAQAASGEHVHGFEETRLRKDGARIDVSVQISAVKSPEGQVIGVSTISRDITERKRRDEELQQAREKLARHAADLEKLVDERTASLREKTKQLESFCYTVAHDLRAPLRSINGYAQFVRLDYEHILGPEAKAHLHQIEASAKRLDGLIQDLLAYTRVDQLAIVLGPVDLDITVDCAFKQLAGTISNTGAQVEVRRPLPTVSGDEATLQHVFLNLISNAMKFTPPGVPPRVTVYAEDKGDRVRIWVEDNGIGVPPQYGEKIFGMFERLHDNQSYAGTGIGLAIVSKAMERMGGSRGVEPNPAGGSRFWIELPRSSAL